MEQQMGGRLLRNYHKSFFLDWLSPKTGFLFIRCTERFCEGLNSKYENRMCHILVKTVYQDFSMAIVNIPEYSKMEGNPLKWLILTTYDSDPSESRDRFADAW